MEKKTASIITMHCPLNYGAVLQTYALQTYLQSLYLKTSVIDYTPYYIVHDQSLMYVGDARLKKHLLTRWLYRLIKAPKKIKRIKNFYEFNKKELCLTNRCETFGDIIAQNFNFDYCFCGSDQIWNDRNNSGEDPSYYLQFAKGKSILISYAASGNISLPLKDKVLNKTIPMINDLDFISMREDVTISNIQSYIKKPISHVCDPVFLLTKEQWSDLIKRGSSLVLKGDYVLAYPMGANPTHVIDNAYIVAKHYRLPLYCISATQRKDKRVDKYLDVSPYDFLYILSKSSYIVTNSFHGTAFSILLNKPFWSCEVEGTNQRISSLLKKIGLSSRTVAFDERINPNSINVNYLEANNKLQQFIEYSKKFIKDSIGYK